MSDNSAKNINYYGQLVLLVLASICCILVVTPLMMFSLFLMYLLPILGIWQAIDFVALWRKNGYKKWYNWYIGAMIGFVLLLGFVVLLFSGYIPISYNTSVSNFYIILIVSSYTVVVAWFYLLKWRKQ